MNLKLSKLPQELQVILPPSLTLPEGNLSLSKCRWVTIAEGKGAVPSSRTGQWSVGEQLWGTTGLWALPEQFPANTWPSEHAPLWFI